jgi:hypothetical protein
MKSKIRKLPFLLLAFLSANLLMAQNAVVTTGGTSAGTGGSVSYTVGQIAYSTASGTSGSANQGVQQPYEFYSVGLTGHPAINLQLVVYPNPTLSELTLSINDFNSANLFYHLYDDNGKLLNSQIIQSDNTVIPMAHLSAGSYLLKVIDGKTELRNFKVIKH